ncbi:MAG: hypothetical protein OEY34_01550, partial [Cyclobacteriaceae bacterium]|nr:hypothetical protein [Cyclobacteriaceae bacterium]
KLSPEEIVKVKEGLSEAIKSGELKNEAEAVSIWLKEKGIEFSEIFPEDEEEDEEDPVKKAQEAEEKAEAEAKEKADREAADKEAQKGEELKAQEEADRKAREEADKKAAEEAQEEADRKAKEKADKKAKEEADKKAKEEADKQRLKEAKDNKEGNREQTLADIVYLLSAKSKTMISDAINSYVKNGLQRDELIFSLLLKIGGLLIEEKIIEDQTELDFLAKLVMDLEEKDRDKIMDAISSYSKNGQSGEELTFSVMLRIGSILKEQEKKED